MVPVLLWSSYLIVAVVLLLCFLSSVSSHSVEVACQLRYLISETSCFLSSVLCADHGSAGIGMIIARVATASMDDRMVERSYCLINSPYSYTRQALRVLV